MEGQRVAAIILAAGSGSRVGRGRNKMFLPVDGKPLLCHTLEALERSGVFNSAVIACRQGEEEKARECAALSLSIPFTLAIGGDTRQKSVQSALLSLGPCDIVAVHDGARCNVSPDTFAACVDSARRLGSGVACSPVTDTLRRVSCGVLGEVVDRSTTAAVQTPQAFRADWLIEAYERAEAEGFEATDDSALVSRMGRPVYYVSGGYGNLKVTTDDDYQYMRFIRESGGARCGLGFDSHAFASGRELILGGVRLKHHKGLIGHSDADVLIHAVIDALLGAAGLPDIGELYPDSDPAYLGADSVLLLRDAAKRAYSAGFRPAYIDAVVVLDAPRLGAAKLQMAQNIARACGMKGGVSVKAKTAEGINIDAALAFAVCTLAQT